MSDYDTDEEELYDEEAFLEADLWSKKMELEDDAIDDYHRMQDEYKNLPDIFTYVKWFFAKRGYSYADMTAVDYKYLPSVEAVMAYRGD